MLYLMDRREWLQTSGAAIFGSVALPLIGSTLFTRLSTASNPRPVRMNLDENPYGPSPKVFERFMSAYDQVFG